MPAVTVKLSDPLAARLQPEAQRSQRSQSDIIREALQEKLASAGDAAGTLAEALANLRGIVSGPRDLSTNPEHLREFGT